MHIRISSSSGTYVVRLAGELLGEPEHSMLRDKVRTLIAQGQRQIVIDLSGVKHTNSCGLGALVCLLTTAMRNEGTLRLAGLSPDVHKLFVMTHLDHVFRVYPTVSDAVRDMNASPAGA